MEMQSVLSTAVPAPSLSPCWLGLAVYNPVILLTSALKKLGRLRTSCLSECLILIINSTFFYRRLILLILCFRGMFGLRNLSVQMLALLS